MRKILVLAAVTLVAGACSQKPSSAPAAPASASPQPSIEGAGIAVGPALEQIWLAQGFSAPEGVARAPDGGYYISNVGGEETAGDGYVSKVAEDGSVLVERFIDGLDGPKGMAVHEGFLIVADETLVRIFDADTGESLDAAEIEGAKFLNDATVWQDDVFVSDSGTGRIWRFTGTSIDLWREGDDLAGVNGLLGDGERLLITTMTSGSLIEATIDGGWKTIASGMIDADGVGIVPEAAGGGYLVSAWPGEIWHVANDGSKSSILNTREAGILQNDLTILDDVVIVPNWEPGTVTAWRIAAR